MLRRQLKWLLSALGVLAVVYVAIAWDLPITYSPIYPNKQSDEHSNSDRLSENSAPTLGFIIGIFCGDAWDVLHRDREEFIAIGTIFLAAFTAAMWWSTRKSVKAIVGNERPWVGLATPHGFERIEIMNFGRTPALQMRAKFCWRVLPIGVQPPAISTENESPKPLFPLRPDYYAANDLSNTDLADFSAGDKTLWVTGRIDYFDHQGVPHWTTILLRWDIGIAQLIPHEIGNDAT
jgi:hypothetical protein